MIHTSSRSVSGYGYRMVSIPVFGVKYKFFCVRHTVLFTISTDTRSGNPSSNSLAGDVWKTRWISVLCFHNCRRHREPRHAQKNKSACGTRAVRQRRRRSIPLMKSEWKKRWQAVALWFCLTLFPQRSVYQIYPRSIFLKASVETASSVLKINTPQPKSTFRRAEFAECSCEGLCIPFP